MAGENYIQGNDVLFYIRANGGWKVVSCLIDNPLTEDVEVIETTARGSGGWRSFIPGIQNYEITLNAHMVVGSEYVSYEHLKQLKRGLVVFDWRLMSLDGAVSDEGSAFISSLDIGVMTNEIVSFTATLTPGVGGIGNIMLWSEDGFNVVSESGLNGVQIK